MLASILATAAIVPIIRVSLDVPKLLGASFDDVMTPINDTDDQEVTKTIISEVVITIAFITAIISFMYFRIEAMAWRYNIERRNFMKNPEKYDRDEESQLKNILPFVASFCMNYTPDSLFFECKATRRKMYCFLIPALTGLIQLFTMTIQMVVDDGRGLEKYPFLATILPTKMNTTNVPLIISCMQTVLFQLTHFLYLRHVRKRPYLSFRPSKVYGDTLNDTEVLATR